MNTIDNNENDDQLELDLKNIQTQWSIVREAHVTSNLSPGARDARRQLVLKYAPAISRFVRMIVRDDSTADEISQDAVVRMLKGDFAGADPSRGRFRDLLRTALRNMVRNYWAKENRRRGVDIDLTLIDENAEETTDDAWTVRWREHLLSLSWNRLEQWQASHSDSVAFQILRLRADFPDDSSTTLAKKLSDEVGRTFSAESTRQQLRRARLRFAEFLITEIAHGLTDPTPERVQDELIALGLYASVKDVLPTNWT